jgi:hypothetical protein
MKLKLIRRIDERTMIPAGYGVAWFDWVSGWVVVAPLPLVPFICFGRWLWASMRTCFTNVARDPRTAYLDGMEAGIRLGRTYPAKPGWTLRAGNRFRTFTDL